MLRFARENSLLVIACGVVLFYFSLQDVRLHRLQQYWLTVRPEMRGAMEQGCVYVEPIDQQQWRRLQWAGANQRIRKGWGAITDGERSWCEKE